MANLLAHSIDGEVINHDVIKALLLENGNSFDQSAKLTYRFQWVCAEIMMRKGRTVIIDSTCNYKETLDQGTALARQYGYDYTYVECRVNDIDLLDERLRSRVPLRSQRTGINCPPPDSSDASHREDGYALFRRWIQNPWRPDHGVIVMDSTGNLEDCLRHVLKHIIPLSDEQVSK